MADQDSARACDRDRDAAVERLRIAASEGRLTLEELTGRTEAIHNSRTYGELGRVTADLPEQPTRRPPVRHPARNRIVSVFGDVTRSGAWRADEQVTPIAVFGDVDLDLRQATVSAGEVTITVIAPFGNIDALVPEGVEVDVSGFTLFGSKKIAVREATLRGSAPVVRVRAFSVFGSVKVWSP